MRFHLNPDSKGAETTKPTDQVNSDFSPFWLLDACMFIDDFGFERDGVLK